MAQEKIRLNANESPFGLSAASRERLGHALNDLAYNRYPDPTARDLIRAFSAHYQVDPAQVIAGNGSDELLQLLMLAYAKVGKPVALSSPDFSMYDHYAQLAGVEPLALPKDEAGRLDGPAYLAAAQAAGCGMLLFSNPCNPMGQGLSRAGVLDLAASFDGLVVVDEAYMDFWDQTVLDQVHPAGNLAVLRTASKAFGLAALRLGFGVLPIGLLEDMLALKSPYNVSSLSQVIGSHLYDQPDQLADRIASIVAGREKLEVALEDLVRGRLGYRVYPSVTNFVYFEVPDAPALDDYLQGQGIIIRRFDDRGLRVTCGLPEENAAFIQAVADFLERRPDDEY